MYLTFFLLRDLFFTCFASFFYLVIHSILFHYIHAFIRISCAPMIILDHLNVFRVKLATFLYPLSIITKRGRNCVDFVVSFFKILHVRGRNTCLCKRELCFILLGGVLTSFFLYLGSCDHVYIHCAFLWRCRSSSPTLSCVVSFLSLYTCFLLFVCNLLILFHTKMFWWVLFKVFQKYRLLKSTCHKLSSCKFFQEFVLG